MTSSAHTDRFVRDHLPPIEQWPDFLFSLPELDYPDRLNCVVELLDRWVATGHGERACLISHTETLTYAQLAERVNRIANVLTRDLGMVPGHRVLLRGPNNPMLIAACLAVIKAGGVAVPTMPLLRAGEISFPIAKARVALALCDLRLGAELAKSKTLAPELERIVYYSGEDRAGGLDALMRRPGYEHFSACDTASDDVCLIAFTSGTSGTCCAPAPTIALSARRRSPSRSASADWCCSHCGSAPRPCFWKRPRRMICWPRSDGFAPAYASRPPRPIGRCCRSSAITISPRCANACQPAKRSPRRRSRLGVPPPAFPSWTASARPRCCTSSSARRRRRSAPALPASRFRVTKRAWSMTMDASSRPARSAGWRCAGRPAAAISPTSGRRPTSRTAGTSPAIPT